MRLEFTRGSAACTRGRLRRNFEAHASTIVCHATNSHQQRQFEMASAANTARLCLIACRRAAAVRSAPGANQIVSRPASLWRDFSTSRSMLAGRRRNDDDDEAELELKEMDKSFLDNATPEGLRQLDDLAKTNGAASIDEFIDSTLRSTPGLSSEDRQLSEDLYKDDVGEKPNKSSFWFDEEDPETNTEDHDEFDEDDITSMAHGKLEEVREMRHYTRLAVWDMPLLSSKSSITKNVLADAKTWH